MGQIDKLFSVILITIFSMYLLINAFVPQLSGWADDLSCVNAVNYDWTVYLLFLGLIFAIVYGVVKSLGIGTKK